MYNNIENVPIRTLKMDYNHVQNGVAKKLKMELSEQCKSTDQNIVNQLIRKLKITSKMDHNYLKNGL
jgi:hypothetical protein